MRVVKSSHLNTLESAQLARISRFRTGFPDRLLALVLTAAVFSVGLATRTVTAEEPSVAASRDFAKQLSAAFRYASRQVLPSVVSIQKDASSPQARDGARDGARDEEDREPSEENPFEGTPFERFFNDPELREFFKFDGRRPLPPGRPMGMGTGVIIDPAGVILTNNHVVEGRGRVKVRLNDGTEHTATKVRSDKRTDLAIVWIETEQPLKAAKIGDSDQLEIGDWVLAVGHPFGLYETVTAGIISAKNRGIHVADREEFLQTDAAINPGNSGGPLINLDGEVVGINTAISSQTGGYQGAGFAIPINMANWVAGQLVQSGEVRRAYLGTGIGAVTPELTPWFHRPGALITEVRPDSPAQQAGMQPGDVVIRFGVKGIRNPRDLQSAVERAKVEGSLPMEIVRNDKRMTLTVSVRFAPQGFFERRGPRLVERNTDVQGEWHQAIGAGIGELSQGMAEQLKVDAGVLITSIEPRGPAARARLAPGMAILQVNRRPVASPDDFGAALKPVPGKNGVLLLIRSPAGSRFIVVERDE